jgi:hypothetical protein
MWAKEHGYNLLLDKTQRVFIAVEKRDRTAAKQLKVIDDALEVIEELGLAEIIATTPQTHDGTERSTSRPMHTLPPSIVAAPGDSAGFPTDDPKKNWGRAAGMDPARIPTIAFVHDQETLDSLLQHWMTLRPELDWDRHVHEDLSSFISEDPLFAVIVTRKTKRKEWDLEHETAALLTRLMLKRAHGPLPKWIEAGLTWQVETRLFQSIWHFFARESRFVASSSHSGWEREVRSIARRRKQAIGLFEDAAEFDPKDWRDEDAFLAWGLMGVLKEELDGGLPLVLNRISLLRDAGARIEEPDGSWHYDTAYIPTVSEQYGAFADILGEELEERALKSLKRGLKRTGEPR